MAGPNKASQEAAAAYGVACPLSEGERIDWLRLIRSGNVGPKTFQDLIQHYGSAGQALEALPELSRRGGRSKPAGVFSLAEAEAELALARAIGAKLVAIGDPGYPARLGAVDAPVPVLYVKGRLELADRPIVAIVGARNASALGKKFTRMIANDLGGQGYVIASGLARGIDTAAHTAALELGTVAVLAGGIDNIYPPENQDLHTAIGEQGILASERPPGFAPRAKDFPRRNRLISGMAAATLVVEAAKRSGSLITARFAAEQGREVFAVPGNPLDPRAAGTNALLQEGAGLVVSAQDIITTLAPILGQVDAASPRPSKSGTSKPELPKTVEIAQSTRDRVREALGLSPVDVDEVIRATGLSAREVHVILLELDLAGRLARHGRQLVALKS